MRGEKMKGIFVGTVLLIAILTLVLSGAFFVVLSSEYINLKTSLKASEILIAADIVEAVKIALERAYYYSFIQAAYDIGKSGGYNDITSASPWRNYSNTNLPYYIENLSRRIETYIKEYLSELENFEFSEPNVEIKVNYKKRSTEIRSVIMSVGFSQPFKYKGRFFTIYENPNRTLFLPSEYFEMFEYGRKNFVDTDSIREKIEAAINEMDNKCREILIGDICEDKKPNPDDKLSDLCPDANESLSKAILQKIKELEDENVSLSIDKILVKHRSKEKYDSVIKNSMDCACKSVTWIQVNNTTACDEFCVLNNYEYSQFKDEKCYCGKCEQYYDKYVNLRYEYEYLAAVNVIVNITTNSEYLVYDSSDGETRYRKLYLIFNVTTSNDYNWTPYT